MDDDVGQVREITGPEAQATRDQADFDSPLVDYRAKGNTVELVGPETVDGVKVYHLKVTTKAGQVQHYFLDADSGLERQTSITLNQNGAAVNVVSILSDYRDVEGSEDSVQHQADGQRHAGDAADDRESGIQHSAG